MLRICDAMGYDELPPYLERLDAYMIKPARMPAVLHAARTAKVPLLWSLFVTHAIRGEQA